MADETIDEKMWVLDKSENFALSAWLAQAGNVRREINRLSRENWAQVKSRHALSFSILRRYIGYWNAYKDLTNRESMGTHGGTYAEEIVASVIRAWVRGKPNNALEVQQNEWLKELKKEPDISIWAPGAPGSRDLLSVVEVKTVLDKAQWEDVKEQRTKYHTWRSSVSFWLVALRAAGLTASLRSEIDQEPWACVLWDKGGPATDLREKDITIWKPIETLLEAAIEPLDQYV